MRWLRLEGFHTLLVEAVEQAKIEQLWMVVFEIPGFGIDIIHYRNDFWSIEPGPRT